MIISCKREFNDSDRGSRHAMSSWLFIALSFLHSLCSLVRAIIEYTSRVNPSFVSTCVHVMFKWIGFVLCVVQVISFSSLFEPCKACNHSTLAFLCWNMHQLAILDVLCSYGLCQISQYDQFIMSTFINKCNNQGPVISNPILSWCNLFTSTLMTSWWSVWGPWL